jgi:hypothetical protein
MLAQLLETDAPAAAILIRIMVGGVVAFYYRNAPVSAADGQPLDVAPLLHRSYSEIALIVAFLESLTEESPTTHAGRLSPFRSRFTRVVS